MQVLLGLVLLAFFAAVSFVSMSLIARTAELCSAGAETPRTFSALCAAAGVPRLRYVVDAGLLVPALATHSILTSVSIVKAREALWKAVLAPRSVSWVSR